MTKRIVALSCCLSLLSTPVVAADENSETAPTSLTLSVVRAAPQPGPIRQASLRSDTVTMLSDDTRAADWLNQDVAADKGSWVERHPVWTGAIVGFSAGFAITYAATHNERDEFIKIMSPSAGATFWGGVCAGVGALAGWSIGRHRDED